MLKLVEIRLRMGTRRQAHMGPLSTIHGRHGTNSAVCAQFYAQSGVQVKVVYGRKRCSHIPVRGSRERPPASLHGHRHLGRAYK